MTRPTNDEYYIEMVRIVATRGTCIRRKVGCILVDERYRILASGFNGVPPGHTHCIDIPCGGEGHVSGSGLENCRAIHAEANALIHCKSIDEIYTAYVTVSPCVHCVKLLLMTPCQRIVFIEEYPHNKAKQWWLEAGREWEHFNTV